MSIRRRKTGGQRPYKKYDFWAEVDTNRLEAIGAIALAWNWIEGAIDTCVAMALEIHPDMWVDVTSRINGMDGKTAILKKCLPLEGYPQLSSETQLPIRKTINAVERYKKLRDGIIHARLIHPDAIIADTAQRKGLTDEVLLSEMALMILYRHLQDLAEEVDWLVMIFYYRHRASERALEDERQQNEEHLRQSLALHHQAQTTREGLPPLPEFPDEPQEPLGSEAAQSHQS
jgi:hypothetical protein